MDSLCQNIVTKVYNLYLYYLKFNENDIKKLCSAIKINQNFQDLRIYASVMDINHFATYLEENDSIWLISFSFNNLKPSDAESFIEILKKCRRVKEV